MKILIYNWCQFDDPHMAGGGVSLYLRNIIRELSQRDDVEVYFLSAGRDYGFVHREPFIKETKNAFTQNGVKSFKIVNSPIKAPAHDAFHSIEKWLSDEQSTSLIKDYINEHGPFDAFHVHNLEGVSAQVLALEKDQNLKGIFYTFHNYMPLCPQIELLYRGKNLCENYFDGHRCVSCMGHNNRMDNLISFQRVASSLTGRGLAGTPQGNFLFSLYAGAKQLLRAFKEFARDIVYGFRNGWSNWRLKPKDTKTIDQPMYFNTAIAPPNRIEIEASNYSGQHYKQWRETNCKILKSNVDGVFAVSDLARDTVKRFMVENVDVISLPLPMDFSAHQNLRGLGKKSVPAGKDFTLSFIGYAIPSKGLSFMIDAFCGIEDDFYKNNVNLVLVARIPDTKELVHLKQIFKSVAVVPGYKRSQLPALAKDIDLNIVPSIWWETLNQVTIELGLLGVPSLVSDRVGAKQVLGDRPDLIFEAENKEDFLSKLHALVTNPKLHESFDSSGLNVPDMESHVETLLKYYRGDTTS